MDTLKEIPEWLGAAIIGAIFATLGYIAKLVLEWLAEINERRRSRRAHLVELFSMLEAGRVSFIIQAKHRNKLLGLINNRDPKLAQQAKLGYDRIFAMAYPNMPPEEQELHQLIRALTEFTFRPLNESMLNWLREDNYFKARTWGRGLKTDLAKSLSNLEVHLLLWMAKYNIWIPDSPENSLVYLNDEKKQGIGFPKELQGQVERVLEKWWLLGA